MSYYCRVEKDSLHPDNGRRATTFVIRFPRRVLAETVTHRVNRDNWGDFEASWCERTTDDSVSKNSASSRAIPFDKMVQSVESDPFYPMWTMNQKGMQGEGVTDPEVIKQGNIVWGVARENAVRSATRLHQLGFHKQDCNRLLEPFAWVTQVVTGSRWDNFFALRCHAAADPHFRHVARMMYLERKKSTPARLYYGRWHLPFVRPEESGPFRWTPDFFGAGPPKLLGELPDLIRYSAARCAWVSYENHDKDGSPEALLKTFDRLLAGAPVHASPVEHQLSPLHHTWESAYPSLKSNVTGWLQARKLIPHEEVREYNPTEEEVKAWGMSG